MASQYQHRHTYDLFISYSSRDQKWVRQFQRDLVEEVNRFADWDVFPFFDQIRLEPGYLWNEQLLAAAEDSAILVPVLTPRFFGSDYCQKEVRAFVEAFGFRSLSPHRTRIKPVKLLCSAPADHVLAQTQAASFCAEGEDGIPYEYAPGTAEYKEAMTKLAYAVAQMLRAVPPNQQCPSVYLASDFKPATDRLRASLEHYFDVLPLNATALLGLSPEELHLALDRDFGRCFVSVHPLTDAPFAKPLIEAQLDCARRQKKPRLIWSQQLPQALANEGFEWLKSQAEIEDRIRRLHQKPSQTKSPEAECLIYFVCPDRANKARAGPLLDELEKMGVHVYPSPLDGEADHALRTHVEALDTLDGCLIYYGDIGRDWFDSVFFRVRKKIRERNMPSAVFLAPPPSPHKTEDLGKIGVPIVSEAEAAALTFLATTA